MDLGVLKQCLREEALASGKDNKNSGDAKPKETQTTSPTTEKGQEQISPHRLLMDIILK